MVRSVELSLTNSNKANSLPLKSRAYVVSESRSPLARAAPDSKELRLRWRFHADHCCTIEGNCAFTLSILWRSSATTRSSDAESSLERVSAKAMQGEEGIYDGNSRSSCSESFRRDLMEAGSVNVARLSPAFLDNAVVILERSSSTAWTISCSALICPT